MAHREDLRHARAERRYGGSWQEGGAQAGSATPLRKVTGVAPWGTRSSSLPGYLRLSASSRRLLLVFISVWLGLAARLPALSSVSLPLLRSGRGLGRCRFFYFRIEIYDITASRGVYSPAQLLPAHPACSGQLWSLELSSVTRECGVSQSLVCVRGSRVRVCPRSKRLRQCCHAGSPGPGPRRPGGRGYHGRGSECGDLSDAGTNKQKLYTV